MNGMLGRNDGRDQRMRREGKKKGRGEEEEEKRKRNIRLRRGRRDEEMRSDEGRIDLKKRRV